MLNIFDLLWSHHLQFEMFRIVKFIARYLTTIFTTLTHFLYHDFTTLAFIIVAFLNALMPLTRKESLTCTCLTNRNFVSAFSSLFTEQSYYFFASTWAEFDSRRYLLARLTLPLVTHFLAIMFATVQLFVANVITDEFLAPALNFPLFLLTEALDSYLFTALIALALMTLCLAFMLQAVQQPPAGVLTAELTPRRHRAGHSLGLLGAETLHWHCDVAGGARPGVAEHITLLMPAVLMFLPLTVFSAGVWQSQR